MASSPPKRRGRSGDDPAANLVSRLINEHTAVQTWPSYNLDGGVEDLYGYRGASATEEGLFGSLDEWSTGMRRTGSGGAPGRSDSGLFAAGRASSRPLRPVAGAGTVQPPSGSTARPNGGAGTERWTGTVPTLPEGRSPLASFGNLQSPPAGPELSVPAADSLRLVCCCLCSRVRPSSWYASADYAVQLLVWGALLLTGTDARHAPHVAGNGEDNLDLNTAVPGWLSLCSLCTPAHVRRGRGFLQRPCHMTWWGIAVGGLWALTITCLWLAVRFFFWQNTPFEGHHLHSALLADLLVGSTASTLSALFLVGTTWSGTLAREAHRYARLFHVVTKVARWAPPTCCGRRVACVSALVYEKHAAKLARGAAPRGRRPPPATGSPAPAPGQGTAGLSQPLLIARQPRRAASETGLSSHLTSSLAQHSALQDSIAATRQRLSPTRSMAPLPEGDDGDDPADDSHQAPPQEGAAEAKTAPETRVAGTPARSLPRKTRSLPEGVAEVEIELGTVMAVADVTPDGLARTIEDPATAELIVNRTTWFGVRCVLLTLATANIVFRVSTDVRTVTPAWIAADTPLPAALYPFASLAFESLSTLVALGYAYQCTLICELLSGIAASLRSNSCKVADATWLTVLVLRRVQFLNATWGAAAALPAITWAFEAIVTALEAVLNGGFDLTIFIISLTDFLVMLPLLLVPAALVKSMTDLVQHAANLRRLRVLRALRMLDRSCTDSGRLVLLQELTLCDGLATTVTTSNIFARVVGVPITFSLFAKFYTLVASALYLFGRLASTSSFD